MDKIIKTISENGSFRAYVLDSTETVRTAQEKRKQVLPLHLALLYWLPARFWLQMKKPDQNQGPRD